MVNEDGMYSTAGAQISATEKRGHLYNIKNIMKKYVILLKTTHSGLVTYKFWFRAIAFHGLAASTGSRPTALQKFFNFLYLFYIINFDFL